MKKFLLIFVMAFIIFINVFGVEAASEISYLGDAGEFVSTLDNDLFSDFKNMMPGDKVTSQIEVKNAASKNVKIKLYMRSLGATDDTDEFLSQLKLTVKQDGNTNMYEGDANKSGDLGEWCYLGTIYSGGKVKLDVELEVPLELNNDYQNSVGYVEWQFKVEKLPVEDSDPVNPNTIDSIYVYLLVGVCLLVILIIVILLIIMEIKNKKARQSIKKRK